MPSNCCAVGCSNNLNKGIKTYCLPIVKNDQQRRQIWISRIKRQDRFNYATARLCAVSVVNIFYSISYVFLFKISLLFII